MQEYFSVSNGVSLTCKLSILRYVFNPFGPHYKEAKRRYFHAFWPLIYTKSLFFLNDYFLKNSGQSRDF